MTLTYAPSGRLARQQWSDGPDFLYQYDDAGRLSGFGGASFEYEPGGRITRSNGIELGLASGRVTSVMLSAGKVVAYGHDARGLVTSVTDWVGGVTTLDYDAARRLIALTRPNGVVTSYEYDDDDRLVGIQDGTLAATELVRDAVGNVTSAVRDLPLSATPALGVRALAFDAAGQVEGFSYDALGRLLDDGVRSYSWDLASRLTSVTRGANTVSYTYDDAGQLATRSSGGVTQQFVWNYGLGLPTIDVVREGASDLAYQVRLPDGRLLHTVDALGVRRFHHHDELGGTTFLSDEAGGVAVAYAHDPYGMRLGTSGSGDSAFPNPFTWQGEFYDAETELYYLRARWYDPATARFLSRDPVDGLDPLSANRYAFGGGNPLRYTDPLGLTPTLPGDGTTPQVMVEVRFAETSRSLAAELGIPWAMGTPPPRDREDTVPPTLLLSSARDELLLRAISADQTANALSTPLSFSAASTFAGLSFGTELARVADGDRLAAAAAGVNATPLATSGVELQFLPQIESGGVRIEIVPRAAAAGAPLVLPRMPANARAVILKFRLLRRLGQLLLPRFGPRSVTRPAPRFHEIMPLIVLGGLLQVQDSLRTVGVPGLSSVPLLNNLFRGRQRVEGGTDLQVFLRPTIVRTEEE